MNKRKPLPPAKNYLTEHETIQLQRRISAYLDLAKDMAQQQIPMNTRTGKPA